MQFLPRRRGQEIRLWPTSSVPYHDGWFMSVLQRHQQRVHSITKQNKTPLKADYCGFIIILLALFYRALSAYYESQAAVVLAYLSLGVSLGVVVEEEGEG